MIILFKQLLQNLLQLIIITVTASDDKVSIFPSSTLSVVYSPSSSDVEMTHISTVETLTINREISVSFITAPTTTISPSHFSF